VTAQAAGFDCNDSSANYHPYADESDCTDPNDYNCDGSVGFADEDADGWAACAECDDSRADTNPDAPEIWYDGIDQDCDGSSDYDADQDGYDFIQWGGDDCDDEEPGINPGVEETPYDGIDQDCDGADLTDVDGDGYDGSEAGGEDCDDTDADIHPGADDLEWDGIDQDCDGEDGPGEGPDNDDTGDGLDTGEDLNEGDLKAGGCGRCSSGPNPAGALPLWLFALAWVGGRTRRSENSGPRL
jgi:MYXO-CTERM domain-containing protein